MSAVSPIRFSSWLLREQIAGLARADLQMVVVSVATYLDRPTAGTGEATFAAVSELGFPCQQVTIRRGRRGIGLLAAFVVQLNDGATVVLFIKEGRNLSIKDRNDIRAAYAEELRGRFDD